MKPRLCRPALFITVILLFLATARPPFVARLEDKFERICTEMSLGAGRPQMPATSAPGGDQIIIIAADEKSIRELGVWPWPKGIFLQIMEKLRARDVGLMIFESSMAHEAGLADMRLPFNREGGTDTIIGYDFYPGLGDVPQGTEFSELEGALKQSEEVLAFPSTPSDDSPLPVMAGIKINRLSPAERGLVREGFGNIFPDADGVVRSQPLAARLRYRAFPSLAVAAAGEWIGFTPIIIQDASSMPTGIAFGERKIATASDMRLPIKFRGKAGSFKHISVADLINGKIQKEEIEGRIALIGTTSNAFHEMRATPLGMMPEALITANVLADILDGHGLTAWTGRGVILPAVLVLGLLFMFVIWRMPIAWQCAASAILISIFLAGGYLLFKKFSILTPALGLSIATIKLLIFVSLWRIIAVDLPLRALKRELAGRLSEHSVAAIAADPSLLAREVRKAEATALSIDIKGFGALTAALTPVKLALFMREFRSAVTETLTNAGAFIESWSGDECRAIFGCPIPAKDHAASATAAAIELRKKFTERREELKRDYGIEKLRIEIGIHTAIVTAGDIGSTGLGGFGISGPAIETACQLKMQNRVYRTSILIGDATLKGAIDTIACRPLDPLTLPGMDKPIMVHELIGEKDTLLVQLPDFIKARDAYLKGDFERAAHLFREILELHPHDGPSQLFLKRALALMKSPPEWKWDGIWR